MRRKIFKESTGRVVRENIAANPTSKVHPVQNGGGFKFQHVVWRGPLDAGYVALCSSKRYL